MVAKGWARKAASWDELLELAQSDQATLNRLALISKQKPDGSWKHRLIWDLLRSQVNSYIAQGERIVLPRGKDVVADTAYLLRHQAPSASI